MKLNKRAWLITLLWRYFAYASRQATPSDPCLGNVVVEAWEIHRLQWNWRDVKLLTALPQLLSQTRTLIRYRYFIERLSLRDGWTTGIRIADTSYKLVQIRLVRPSYGPWWLDCAQAEQKLVIYDPVCFCLISCRSRAHCGIVNTLCHDIRTWATLIRLQVTCWIRGLKRFLCLNGRDCRAIAGVELATTELVIVDDAGRSCSDTTIYVQVRCATCHWVPICATVVSVEVYVDLGDRAPSTDLTFIIQPLALSLSECLLLCLDELWITIQAHGSLRRGLRSTHSGAVCLRLKEPFLCLKSGT